MKADPQASRLVTDFLARLAEDEFLSELPGRLAAGGRGTGLKLSADECRILAELVIKRPSRNAVGRPQRNADEQHDQQLALQLYFYRELENGASVKAATTATEEKFHVSRSSVYAARKRFESK